MLMSAVMLVLWFDAPVDAETGRSAVITALDGEVSYRLSGQTQWLGAELGTVLGEKDTVKTGEGSTCTILFQGMSDSTVDVRPNSVMELSTVASGDNADDTELGLSLGSVLVKAEKLEGESQFEVRTPNSIVGIRGTQFEVNVTEL